MNALPFSLLDQGNEREKHFMIPIRFSRVSSMGTDAAPRNDIEDMRPYFPPDVICDHFQIQVNGLGRPC
jgi:hypothetical protein